MAAAAAGHVQAMQTLVDGGADIHACDRHGLTALMHAARPGQMKAAELLLNLGARANAARGFMSPLILAARGGHDAMVGLLVQRHADLDYAELDGETALIAATTRGHASTVAQLLKLGASLQATCARGYTALEHAQKTGHREIIKLLRAGHPAARDN
jgi:ankyrin repeat protein